MEREGWGGGTLMWERNIDWLPSIHAPTGARTHNPGMCPDRESNPQPLVHRTMLQPTEQPSQDCPLFKPVCLWLFLSSFLVPYSGYKGVFPFILHYVLQISSHFVAFFSLSGFLWWKVYNFNIYTFVKLFHYSYCFLCFIQISWHKNIILQCLYSFAFHI